MHIGKTFALFCLSSGAVSYKIRAFAGRDCSGEAKEVNVWDNTCRNTNIFPTKSIRVLGYGAHRQRATFFLLGGCGAASEASADWWADGGSDEFKKDACLDFSGFQMNAYGSVSS